MEQHILDLINREWTNPALDLFMVVMSSFNVWLAPLAIGVAAALVYGRFRARATILCGVIVLGIGDGGVCNSLKKMVNKPRPYQVLAGVRLPSLQHGAMPALFKPLKIKVSHPETGVIVGRSFPSAHTFNNFAAATLLAFFYRRRGWLYFIPAACVGYSRIYTGAHWPGDVLASAFLGIGWGLLCLTALEFLWRRFGAHTLPTVFARHPSLFQRAAE